MKYLEETKLGDVVTFQRGYDITVAEQTPGSIPIVSSSGISSYHGESKVKGPGIVIGRKGTLGTVHFITSDFWPHDTTLWVRDFKGNVPQFIRYFLPALRLEAFDTGSSNPTLNRNHIHKIRIKCPKPDVQRKIAAILTAYDDLIENNKRRIALLEKMAEEIYREWFVRLRFPGHASTPVHKGVPKGWISNYGSQFFSVIKGKSYTSLEISDEETGADGEVPFLSLKSVDRLGGYRASGLKYYRGRYSSSQVVKGNDVIMAVTDMTQDRAVVGQVARVPGDPLFSGVISLDLVKLVPKTVSANFLYSYMRFSGFGLHIREFANGANVLHLKPELIGRQRMVFPSAPLVEAYDLKTVPLFEMADLLSRANERLEETRDLLLGRLISGKLRVDQLDIQFPPSMRESA